MIFMGSIETVFLEGYKVVKTLINIAVNGTSTKSNLFKSIG